MARIESLRQFLSAQVVKQLEQAKEKLEALEQDAISLKRRGKTNKAFQFEVILISLWASDGESGIDYLSPKPEFLYQAIQATCEKFKRQNSRNDVQADVQINIVLPNGTKISLPEEKWRNVYNNYK